MKYFLLNCKTSSINILVKKIRLPYLFSKFSDFSKNEFKVQLAKDLKYSRIVLNDTTLEKYIYKEFDKRLGHKTAYIKKYPFIKLQIRSAYTTKKVVKKMVPKALSKPNYHCSVYEKAGHIKVNYSRIKQVKKVNYIYHAEEKDSKKFEEKEEYIEEEDEKKEKKEIEKDDEYNIDDDFQNCYAVKKSEAKWSFYKKNSQANSY